MIKSEIFQTIMINLCGGENLSADGKLIAPGEEVPPTFFLKDSRYQIAGDRVFVQHDDGNFYPSLILAIFKFSEKSYLYPQMVNTFYHYHDRLHLKAPRDITLIFNFDLNRDGMKISFYRSRTPAEIAEKRHQLSEKLLARDRKAAQRWQKFSQRRAKLVAKINKLSLFLNSKIST